ncbi:mitochondrial inner membrane protein OXA1-like isoform X1 [Salvia miltiorrhiza]|uniref:mitochondrial inner membrane protein OXA1-like isoform X1 n=2 Tax=Salvia miltiorrhiza TaxID=226208 RepID=UPI0025AD44F7|nr:mitochondrial inner membrane protein OXA1-like isoform X1 [Salvia miltiorrhiza]
MLIKACRLFLGDRKPPLKIRLKTFNFEVAEVMAYRRSIIARTKLFYQQHQRFAPSFSHMSGSDRDELPAKSINRNTEIRSHFRITGNITSNSLLPGSVSRLMRSEFRTGYGHNFHRNISKVPSDIEGLHDAGDLYGAISAVGEKAVEVAPVVNEAAVAAADSINYLNLIEVFHCCAGLEWWASIAATTVLMRFIFVPSQIYFLQFCSKNFTAIVKHVRHEQISDILNENNEKREAWRKLVSSYDKLHGRGLMASSISGIWFYVWVSYMANNVPSFTTGGTLWFTDLTACGHTDLPILMALTLWLRLELHPFGYLEHRSPPTSGSMLVAVSAYLAAVAGGFPTAVYCYWLTSNLFSIAFGAVMMDPRVRKLLGISYKSSEADK